MTYSIITAARNEEKYISKTLESVVHQSVLPLEWIIINDNSTDRTSDLIASYAKRYSWIKQIDLINFMAELKSTGARVSHILNIAADSLKLEYDLISKLDADTEFENTFFEQILNEFNRNEKLAIASGHLVFEGRKETVSYCNYATRGAVMMIRKDVFKKINGFFESRGRGEDTLFGVAARSYGWETRTFPIYFNHLKPEGSRYSSLYESYTTGFYKGSIPYRFDFFIMTQMKHLFIQPLIIGSILQLTGYFYSRFITRYRPFPEYVRIQLHKEQIGLMKSKSFWKNHSQEWVKNLAGKKSK